MAAPNDWWPRFSDAEYERRCRVMRDAMQERGLDALLIHGAPIFFGTDPGAPNLVYLAGYAAGSHGYLVFPREGEPTLVVYATGHLANAKELSVVDDVRAGNDLLGIAVGRLKELDQPIGTLGIVGNFLWAKASIPHDHYVKLTDLLPDTRMETVTAWYEDVRLLRSTEELSFMEQAAAITDTAFAELRDLVRPGVTEMDLHNLVLRVVHEMGGRIPFGHVGSTSMADPGMVYPNFYPTNRVIQEGDAILVELAAGVGGYFGKLYGTLTLGRPTAPFRDMLSLAADIQEQAFAEIRPDAPASDSDVPLAIGDRAVGRYHSRSFLCGWSTYNTRPAQNLVADDSDRHMPICAGHCVNVTGWITDVTARMGVWLGDTNVMTADGLRRLHRSAITDLDYLVL